MTLAAELALACGAFFLCCYLGTGSDEKNLRSFASYPDRVQALVRADPVLGRKIPGAHAPAAVFLANGALFGPLLFVLGLPLRQADFWGNFLCLTVLGQGLNAFDLLVVDLLWWRHSPRVRFTGTRDRPELYRDPRKHLRAFWQGALLFLLLAGLDGALLTGF